MAIIKYCRRPHPPRTMPSERLRFAGCTDVEISRILTQREIVASPQPLLRSCYSLSATNADCPCIAIFRMKFQ